MSVFWLSAAALLAIALWLTVPVLFRTIALHNADRSEANVTLYRERLNDLASAHRRGEVDERTLTEAREALDRALVADTQGFESATLSEVPAVKPQLAITVALAVPVAAFAVYLQLGTPAALFGDVAQARPTAATQKMPPQGTAPASDAVPHSVEDMVERLASRLRDNPADPEAWVMLGRSYATLNRLEDARAALAEANRQRPDHPLTLVAFAEVLAGLNGNQLGDDAARLIVRALAVDPRFPRALWLGGLYAYRHGDRPGALRHWQHLLENSSLDPRSRQQVQQAIAQVGGRPAATNVAAAVQDSHPEPVKVAAGAPGLKVHVSLGPEFVGQVSGDAVLFIFARAVDGPRMPLAIVRKRVAELPLEVELNDSQAMAPGLALSGFKAVTVSARISSAGNAQRQPGDLEGSIGPIEVGNKAPVNVVINKVVE